VVLVQQKKEKEPNRTLNFLDPITKTLTELGHSVCVAWHIESSLWEQRARIVIAVEWNANIRHGPC
jgi:hypothetical protein